MFMHKKLMELERKNMWLENDNKNLRKEVSDIHKILAEKNEHQFRMHQLNIEEAKNTIRKEMEKSLIESDLKRVEAVAKLNTYIDMDTKDDRKQISQMLDKAITGLSHQMVNIVK